MHILNQIYIERPNMEVRHDVGLFIFSKDLRLIDNTALIRASKECSFVIPCYILDHEYSEQHNPIFNKNTHQFLIQALKDLNQQLQLFGSQLYIFYGSPRAIILNLIQNYDVTSIYGSRDCELKKIIVDNRRIRELTHRYEVYFKTIQDCLLFPTKELPSNINFKQSLKFIKVIKRAHVQRPDLYEVKNFFNGPILNQIHFPQYQVNQKMPFEATRKAALQALRNFNGRRSKCEIDILKSSNLSPYINYGLVSIREVFHRHPSDKRLTQQLYDRQFYYRSLMSSLKLNSLKQTHRDIVWPGRIDHLQIWKDGKTGFPIIDAAMNELKATGYLHYVMKEAVSAFLVRFLLLDWKHGQKYFAQHLVDYDALLNNASWQKIACVGYVTSQTNKTFTPREIAQTYDQQCTYIKKWLPELQNVKIEDIFKWEQNYNIYKNEIYYQPIVNSSLQLQKFKRLIRTYDIRQLEIEATQQQEMRRHAMQRGDQLVENEEERPRLTRLRPMRRN